MTHGRFDRQPMLFSLLFFSLALTIMANSPIVHALDPYTIEISSSESFVYPGNVVQITAKITNNQETGHDVRYIVTNDQRKDYWITLSKHGANIASNKGTDQVVFYVQPDENALEGVYTFRIRTEMSGKPETFSEKTIDIYVRQLTQLTIIDVVPSKKSYDPGEPIDIRINLKNIGTRTSENTTVVVSLIGATRGTVSTKVPPILVTKPYIVEQQHRHDKFKAVGEYQVVATLHDIFGEPVRTKSTTISISAMPKITTAETTDSKMFRKKFEITAHNDGNVQGTATIEKKLLGIGAALDFEQQPIKKGNVYSWSCQLEPNESCTIRYSINYWVYIALIFAIAAILYLAKFKMELPHVSKTTIKGMPEHSVHIAVKNRSAKELYDVEVRDRIPALFDVSHFSVKPQKMRRQEGAIEYVWHLGKFKPHEERIIHYKIKSKLDVRGKIELPKATITVIDSKGMKQKNQSAPVHVE